MATLRNFDLILCCQPASRTAGLIPSIHATRALHTAPQHALLHPGKWCSPSFEMRAGRGSLFPVWHRGHRACFCGMHPNNTSPPPSCGPIFFATAWSSHRSSTSFLEVFAWCTTSHSDRLQSQSHHFVLPPMLRNISQKAAGQNRYVLLCSDLLYLQVLRRSTPC